jgi:hypothetical protein
MTPPTDILTPDEHATFMRDLDGCVPGSHIEHLRRHDTAQRARIDELEMALHAALHGLVELYQSELATRPNPHPEDDDDTVQIARRALGKATK